MEIKSHALHKVLSIFNNKLSTFIVVTCVMVLLLHERFIIFRLGVTIHNPLMDYDFSFLTTGAHL